jgi:dTDP-4-amino-4,6-dideoxygalactose transaminase
VKVDRVPLLDLRRAGAELDAELEQAFGRVLRSGHYILGPEVEAFEQECARYIGVKHALGVSSGTDALLLALMALGIGAGDEVICPTYTFFATAGCIWRTGAKPVFVDCDPETYNITADLIAPKVTPRTKAIVPVHLFGQCADMTPIVELAKASGISIVEDAAQAIGSEHHGRRAGSLGEYGCFSFFPSKNLGALGDAGLVTTNDDALTEKARVYRAHGSKPKYFHHVVGGNFRIDALQAALLRVKLKHLDNWTARRKQNAAAYTELLSGAPRIQLPVTRENRHIYNQYVIRVVGEGGRDRLQAFLKERKIGTEVYYPVPMHLQKCFSSLGHQVGDFPVSELAAAQTVAIPIFPELTREEIEWVASSIVEFCRT